MEETVSTLKFAARAKTIKNHFKMNIKNSHETLQRIIDQLKRELLQSKMEIERLNQIIVVKTSFPEVTEEHLNIDENCNVANKVYASNITTSFPTKRMVENNNNLNKENNDNKLIENIQNREILEMRVISQDKEIISLNSIISELHRNLKKLEEETSDLKTGSLKFEKKIIELTEERDIFKIKYENVASNLEMYLKQININKNEIESLKKALEIEEKNSQKMLSEKKGMLEKNLVLNIPKNYEFIQIKLADYFKESYNFSCFDAKSPEEEKTALNRVYSYTSQNIKQIVELPSKIEDLLSKSQYTTGFKNSLMNKDEIAPELQIFLLRQQLLYSIIINQNLERTIMALEWKQVIEFGKSKITADTLKIQSRYISNLEKILEKARISHQQLRNRVETVEFDYSTLREKFNNFSEKKEKKSRIVKAFNRETQ